MGIRENAGGGLTYAKIFLVNVIMYTAKMANEEMLDYMEAIKGLAKSRIDV